MTDLTEVLFTYFVPFIGVVLISTGIGGAVFGGYAGIQRSLDLCGSPTISVSTPAATERLLSTGPSVDFPRYQVDQLAPSERRAFESGLTDARRQADVTGPFPHRTAFRNGVIVVSGGARYYVTVVSANNCTPQNPVLFPLGIAAIVIGIGGVLTPPAYRKLEEIEERTQ